MPDQRNSRRHSSSHTDNCGRLAWQTSFSITRHPVPVRPPRPDGAGPAPGDDFAENGDADYAPVDAADAVDNYRRVLEIVGAGGRRDDRPQRRGGRPRGQHAQRRRHGHAAPQGPARTCERHGPGRPDGLHAAAQVRRPELPEPDLHDGQRDRQPGRRLAHEHVRPAGHRRDDQRLRQRGDQGRSTCRGSPTAKSPGRWC